LLRAVLLALGVVLLAATLGAAFSGSGVHAVLALGVPGLALTAGILFERKRYKPAEPHRPGPDWIATDERFVDPDSGKTITVFYQPRTGERRYIGE